MSPVLPLPPLSQATTETFLPNRVQAPHVTGGHFVVIYALSMPATCTALLSEEGGKLTGGYGKWEEVVIPRGVPLTNWTGRTLWTMDLGILLDAWKTGQDVEGGIHALEEMCMRPGKGVTPPLVRVAGALPHTELTWVINGIDWGDCLRDFATGKRRRQAMVLHLMEYVEDIHISALRPPPPPPRKVKVKKGDTLKTLAA
jgi:hypothetical protein